MLRRLDDFVSLYADESVKTREVFAALTDASLKQAINNDHRTAGRLAWHITQTIPEMLGAVGLKPSGPHADAPVPASAKAIAEAYDAAAASVAGAVAASGWTDATLTEERPMYGETWTVAFALRAFVFHEVHHRAQLIVLMRQAGLKVPGLYGPAKEDWATFGAPAPEI